MKYKIYYYGKLIAQFLFKSDRNNCLDMLRKLYTNVKFTIEGEQ